MPLAALSHERPEEKDDEPPLTPIAGQADQILPPIGQLKVWSGPWCVLHALTPQWSTSTHR
jgi:hypothetical protein